MPIYTFDCADHHTFDDLRSVEAADEPAVCLCGASAKRRGFYRQRVVGPVWSDMERFESALLSRKAREGRAVIRHPDGIERLPPARFRSARNLERWEQTRGLVRQEDSVEGRRAVEAELDDGRTIARIRRQDGVDAACEHVKRTDAIAEVGCTEAFYREWKSGTDEIEHALATGRIRASDFDTPVPASSPG